MLRLRGSISRDMPWEVMPDLFFYIDPEEVDKEEREKAEAAAEAQTVSKATEFVAPDKKTGELSLTGLVMGSQLLLLLQHQLQLLLLQLLSKLLRTWQLRPRQVTGQLHQLLQLNKHQLPTLGEVLANGDKHGGDMHSSYFSITK